MSKKIESLKNNLKKYLFVTDSELKKLDSANFKKDLFKLLRECIKEANYIFEIGPYLFDITPQTLSVKYDTDNTIIKISNNDVYYESTRDIETRFFCISPERRDEYLMDNPLIRTTGIVTNIDGNCEELIRIELYTELEDNINNYLRLPLGVTFVKQPLEDDYSVLVKKEITKDTPRTDLIDYFDKDRVVPVYLDTVVEKYKTQVDRREYTPNNYSVLLPSLDIKKNLISYIYNSIVEFYRQYID